MRFFYSYQIVITVDGHKLKEKPYWGNRFWARGYCVDTVGLDSEMVQKYIKYQEQKERDSEKPEY